MRRTIWKKTTKIRKEKKNKDLGKLNRLKITNEKKEKGKINEWQRKENWGKKEEDKGVGEK